MQFHLVHVVVLGGGVAGVPQELLGDAQAALLGGEAAVDLPQFVSGFQAVQTTGFDPPGEATKRLVFAFGVVAVEEVVGFVGHDRRQDLAQFGQRFIFDGNHPRLVRLGVEVILHADVDDGLAVGVGFNPVLPAKLDFTRAKTAAEAEQVNDIAVGIGLLQEGGIGAEALQDRGRRHFEAWVRLRQQADGAKGGNVGQHEAFIEVRRQVFIEEGPGLADETVGGDRGAAESEPIGPGGGELEAFELLQEVGGEDRAGQPAKGSVRNLLLANATLQGEQFLAIEQGTGGHHGIGQTDVAQDVAEGVLTLLNAGRCGAGGSLGAGAVADEEVFEGAMGLAQANLVQDVEAAVAELPADLAQFFERLVNGLTQGNEPHAALVLHHVVIE